MKKLAGIVIVFIGLLLLAFYGMGFVTEHTLKNNVVVSNQYKELKLDLADYKRGLFTSNAILKWSLHLPEGSATNQHGQVIKLPARTYDFQAPLVIHHGPFIYADNTMRFGFGFAKANVPLPQKQLNQFKQMFTKESVQPRLRVSIFINFLNHTTLSANVPYFKLISKKDNAQLEWFGLRSDVSASSNVEDVQGNMLVDGFQFIKDKAKVILGKVSSQYNLHRIQSGLYLGDVNVFASSFLIANDEKKEFEANSLGIKTSSDVVDSLFGSRLTASVERVFSGGKTYGPALVDFSIHNLDADVLAKINQQVSQMKQNTDLERRQALITFLPELPKLFSKGAELELSKLSVEMPDGVVTGHLLISLPKADAGNVLELIQKVRGNGQIVVSATAFKRMLADVEEKKLESDLKRVVQEGGVDQEIDRKQMIESHVEKNLRSMLSSGVLVLKNQDYVTEFKLEDGRLLVNGAPFNSRMVRF